MGHDLTQLAPLASDGARPRAVDSLGLALAALALYLALGQTTLYYGDGHLLLERLSDRALPTYSHHLGVALDALGAGVLAHLGVSTHRAITILAALGTSAGVWLTHLGYALAGMSRRDALLAAAIVATTATTVFFATVVEYHGLFFAFSQLSFVAAVASTRRPTFAGAVGLGLLAGLATFAHASGMLLTIALGAWFLGCRSGNPSCSRRRSFGIVAVAVAVHWLVVASGVAGLERLGAGQTPTATGRISATVVLEMLSRFGHAPRTVWEEWLWPYLPLSFACLAAVRPRALRGPFVALVVALAAYLTLCVLIVAFTEHGAYLAPVTALAAPLTVRATPRFVALATIAVGLALGVAGVRRHDDQGPAYHAFTRGVREVAGARQPLLLAMQPLVPYGKTGSVDEVGACLVTDPELDFLNMAFWAQTAADVLAPRLVALPALIRMRARDRDLVLVSAGAIARLEDRAQCPSGHLIVAALRGGFTLERVAAAGFEGFALRER